MAYAAQSTDCLLIRLNHQTDSLRELISHFLSEQIALLITQDKSRDVRLLRVQQANCVVTDSQVLRLCS